MISEDDTIISQFGIDLLEEEIDQVIFSTNEFLTDSTFIQPNGPFWLILQISMGLATVFTLVLAGSMAYKMMVKHEPLDVFKILRVLGISIVMSWWYPPAITSISRVGSMSSQTASVLDIVAYIPNCLGQYTHALYQIEAESVEERYNDIQVALEKRDSIDQYCRALVEAANKNTSAESTDGTELTDTNSEVSSAVEMARNTIKTTSAGLIVLLDKLVMFIALIVYRIGWWGTIYCQQILLGALTIFGPIQWAFSILPKWEGAWAKWLVRYITVQLYGAMLFFTGFYVLLLFDIVLSIELDNLEALSCDVESYASYIQSCFFTAGYLMAASIVACKCLGLVPDLASWIIPEGETAFSARSFGEGVAGGMRGPLQGAAGSVTGGVGRAFV